MSMSMSIYTDNFGFAGRISFAFISSFEEGLTFSLEQQLFSLHTTVSLKIPVLRQDFSQIMQMY
jgi:hypothetical protein